MSSRNAAWYRRTHRDASASGSVAAATAGVTDAVAVKDGAHQIFVQRIFVQIHTSAAQTITFQDDNGTVVKVANIPASAPVGSQYEFNFGARGFALTVGKNLDISGTAGPAYAYVIEAYQRQTGAMYLSSAGVLTAA